MPIYFRKRLKLGPFVLNFTQNGFSSWGLRIGRWSWNARTGAQSVDLPGPLRYRTRGRTRT